MAEEEKKIEEQKAETQSAESQSTENTTKKTASTKKASKESESQQKESQTENKEETSEKKENQNPEQKSEDKKSEEGSKKKTTKKESKPKRNYAIANGIDLPISTKYGIAICKFIRGLPIDEAINKLEEVEKKNLAVPMKGEYGHKKHAKKYASGSGKYPQKAAREFIKLLKNLSANSIQDGLEKTIVSEASANVGSRPMARFGMWKRKRTHVKLIAREKPQKTKKKVSKVAK